MLDAITEILVEQADPVERELPSFPGDPAVTSPRERARNPDTWPQAPSPHECLPFLYLG